MTSAIYVRVSTDRQTLAQTIDQQIERLRLHLTSEGRVLPTSQREFQSSIA